MWRGGLSYRRLWVLVRYLPPESQTQTKLRNADLANLDELRAPEPVRDDEYGPWSQADYLLAEVRDEIARLVFVSARGFGWAQYPEPEPTPRPGVSRRKPAATGMSEADFIFLNALRAPRG